MKILAVMGSPRGKGGGYDEGQEPGKRFMAPGEKGNNERKNRRSFSPMRKLRSSKEAIEMNLSDLRCDSPLQMMKELQISVRRYMLYLTETH